MRWVISAGLEIIKMNWVENKMILIIFSMVVNFRIELMTDPKIFHCTSKAGYGVKNMCFYPA